MMATRRIKSGPNTAWKAGWMPSAQIARARPRHAAQPTVRSAHPLAEPAIAALLVQRENAFETRFNQLMSTLIELAPRQYEPDFARVAVAALSAIDIKADPEWFAADWSAPLNIGDIHARCVTRLFAWMAEAGDDLNLFDRFDGAPIKDLIARWGFHAIDITPCADGRLAGLLGTVLRVPPSIVTARRSYAGAMFDVADAVRNWEKNELGRCRADQPSSSDANSRYLKIGVYHFSSGDPTHAGCAAHGCDDDAATRTLLERLEQFHDAITARYGAPDAIALLLVGVDTDTDAIRVHVPDNQGKVDATRFVDASDLYSETQGLARDDAKDAIRSRVAACAGVATDNIETGAMRWFCGYLLKNNLAQVDAVLQKHGGAYPITDHAEKLMVIGDPLDDVQQRNISFQAQMSSVEEGAGDLAIGLSILNGLCRVKKVSIPVLVMRCFDPLIPGDEQAATRAARRMARAVTASAGNANVTVEAAIRPESGGPLRFVSSKRDELISAEVAG